MDRLAFVLCAVVSLRELIVVFLVVTEAGKVELSHGL